MRVRTRNTHQKTRKAMAFTIAIACILAGLLLGLKLVENVIRSPLVDRYTESPVSAKM